MLILGLKRRNEYHHKQGQDVFNTSLFLEDRKINESLISGSENHFILGEGDLSNIEHRCSSVCFVGLFHCLCRSGTYNEDGSSHLVWKMFMVVNPEQLEVLKLNFPTHTHTQNVKNITEENKCLSTFWASVKFSGCEQL